MQFLAAGVVPPMIGPPGQGADAPLLIIINKLMIYPLVVKNAWSWIAVSLSHDQHKHTPRTTHSMHESTTQTSFRNTPGANVIIKKDLTARPTLN